MGSNGPYCPIVRSHGRMYSVDRAGDPSQGFRCPHLDHGANGKFFTDEEASRGTYELKEADVTMVVEAVARDVVAGKITLDQAAEQAARSANISTSQAREAVSIMIETIEGKEVSMADKKRAAKTAAKAPRPAADRRRLPKTEGSEFARVRDELGLTQKQSKEATAEAGMGASSTYVYILVKDGASTELFNRYVEALTSYAARNKIGPYAEAEAVVVVAEAAPEAGAELDPEDAELEAAEAAEDEVPVEA